VGPTAGLDAVVKRKIPSPRWDSNRNRPARSQSLYRLSYLVYIKSNHKIKELLYNLAGQNIYNCGLF
jgi:hypothetical protein